MRSLCIITNKFVNIGRREHLKIRNFFEKLILEDKITKFFFCGGGFFATMCLFALEDLREKYQYIRLVNIKSNKTYLRSLITGYDEEYCPDNLDKINKDLFLAKHFYVIDKSDICLFYCDLNKPKIHKIYEYAIARNKEIINYK